MIYKTRKKNAPWVSDDEALLKLYQFYGIKGRFPLCQVSACRWCDDDLELTAELKIPNVSTYILHLKSYRTACRMACELSGMTYIPTSNAGRIRGRKCPFYTREYLLEVLIDFKQKNGHYPSCSELRHPLPSHGSYGRMFGGQINSQKEADIKCGIITSLS